MEPDDGRTSSDNSGTEPGLAQAERTARRRARLRLALMTLALVAVIALIAIGIVRILQS
jgi:flagellar biogenesis protein FliO